MTLKTACPPEVDKFFLSPPQFSNFPQETRLNCQPVPAVALPNLTSHLGHNGKIKFSLNGNQFKFIKNECEVDWTGTAGAGSFSCGEIIIQMLHDISKLFKRVFKKTLKAQSSQWFDRGLNTINILIIE